MTLDDWILALHVLSAFSVFAGLLLFAVLIVAVRRTDTVAGTLRLGAPVRVADGAVGIGMGGTLLFGIWLAFAVGGYELWDGWIVAALVLWAVATALGSRAGAAYAAGLRRAQELRAGGETGPSGELRALNRTPRGLLMQSLASAAVLLILIDMIWKPGA